MQSGTTGLLKLQADSANAPGDEKAGQEQTSLITAAQICCCQLGKVTKDFAREVDALITGARFHHK